MSRHFEWLDTDLLELAGPGDDIGADEPIGDGHYALIIGNPWDAAGVIEGPVSELLSFAERFVELVAAADTLWRARPAATPRPGGEEHTALPSP